MWAYFLSANNTTRNIFVILQNHTYGVIDFWLCGHITNKGPYNHCWLYGHITLGGYMTNNNYLTLMFYSSFYKYNYLTVLLIIITIIINNTVK